MKISPELTEEIIEFLSNIPSIDDRDGRMALLLQAGLDRKLLNLINCDNPPGLFFQKVMEVLVKYEQLEDGRNSVEALLQASKARVGMNKQKQCDELLTKLQAYHEKVDTSDPSIMTITTDKNAKIQDQKANRVIKILFLAANPVNTTQLRLDEEIRSIDQALRQSEFREKFDIKQHWAVRILDIQNILLRHQPDIVHFSGHGSDSSEIILEDSTGKAQAVSSRALSGLFSVLKDNIKCVVLNACYSEKQAQAIATHIECVVGMSKAIGDMAAISFATAFYQALGFGRNVKTAFDLGCIQIDLESLDEQDTPKLIASKHNPENIVFVK